MTIAPKGQLLIAEDAMLQGSVHGCARLEVRGYVHGEITVGHAVVAPSGRLHGIVRATSAEVHGDVQGRIQVRDLISIGQGGSVTGRVLYGKLAMTEGASLEADVRNVPPAVFGDLELTVRRGQWVIIEARDLSAFDPDDAASSLTFTVTGERGGFVALAETTGQPVATFTQADLAARRMVFTHRGGEGFSASFDVVVSDASGANSGDARTVQVVVLD